MAMNPEDFKRNQESQTQQVLFSRKKKKPSQRAPMDASPGVGAAAPAINAAQGIESADASQEVELSPEAAGLAAPAPAAPALAPAPILAPAVPVARQLPGVASASPLQLPPESSMTIPNPTVITPTPSRISIVNAAEEKRNAEKRGVKRDRDLSKLPFPNKFIFTVDRFPFYITLPVDLSIQEEGSNKRKLGEDELVVFLDDVRMPFKIIDNKVVIELNEVPFAKLYKPTEFDKLTVLISVYYKKEYVRRHNLDLGSQSQSQGQQNVPYVPNKVNNVPEALGELQKARIYKGIITFFMSAEIGFDPENHSDDDSDAEYMRGVVAKKRFGLAKILKLPMLQNAQETLYKLIQSYLRGDFFLGDPQNINAKEQEKTRRNLTFTATMQKGDTKEARKHIAAILIEVAKYYTQNCSKDADFRNGVLQLLDFSHGLGSIGEEAFRLILNMKNSPFANRKSMIAFRFPRSVNHEIGIVQVMIAPTGEMREILKEINQKEAAELFNQWQKNTDGDSFMANFEESFAKLSLSKEEAEAAASGNIIPDVQMKDARDEAEQPGQSQGEEQAVSQEIDVARGEPARKRRRI